MYAFLKSRTGQRSVFVLLGFVLFYVCFGAYAWLNQDRIAYYPTDQDFYNCPALAAAEPVNHRGTRMYVKNTGQPMAVLYHGNAGSACDRAFFADLFTGAGHDYALVEYAGYSNDPREPSHALVKQDVENVVDYLDRENVTEVTVVGVSIGTGAAAYHASLAAPAQLLLFAPFTDLKDLAAYHYWFYPTDWLVDNAFDNEAALANFAGETLIIHGTEDRIIPHKLSEHLYISLPGPKARTLVPGAGHNTLFNYDIAYTAVTDFLKPSLSEQRNQ